MSLPWQETGPTETWLYHIGNSLSRFVGVIPVP